jgi:tRNA nucleotidyltransferase (CCA-adding enzyme)
MAKEIFDSILGKIKPSKAELAGIEGLVAELKGKIESGFKKGRIKADIFIGGSLAKNTLIKKERYDIDLFARFNFKDYSSKQDKLSNILEKVMKLHKLKYKRIHGSRDYFQIKAGKMPLVFEIVQVLSIKNPKEARNVTDLSFFHVNYVSKHASEKLADDIRLAKAFCYAQNCYGAESYIQGFSGYAVELLVLHFGGFMKFIKEVIKWERALSENKKIVIDSAKHYKNAEDVTTQINEAKLASPVVLVDPTYSARNATASLSVETLLKFIGACKELVKNPSENSFERKKPDIALIRKIAAKKGAKIAVLFAEAKNSKEEVASAKLRKFFDFVVFIMQKNGFAVLRKEIEFAGKGAKIYATYKNPSQGMIVPGPPINKIDSLLKFRKKYKNIFIKDSKAFARANRKIRDIKGLVDSVNSRSEIRDMGISAFNILK